MKSDAYGRRRILQIGVSGFTIGMTGCSQFEKTVPIDELRVSIYDIRRPSVGVTSATLPLILSVENPTSQSIPSPSGEFDVYINGESQMVSNFSLNTVEPRETTRERISIILDYAKTGKAIVDAIRGGGFDVQLRGYLESKGKRADFNLQSRYDE